ncbi:MAG: DUF1549 domain-containing protein, partial [Planctomycetota bacterium]
MPTAATGRRALMAGVLTWLASLGSASAGDTAAVRFDRDIRPIFTQHCVACHGGLEQAAGLSLTRRESAIEDAGVVVPGSPADSLLLDRVADRDDDFRMPPPEHGPRLTDAEVARLRAWIEAGASWPEHWSFTPLESPPAPPPVLSSLPPSRSGEWGRRPLDSFVLRRLKAEGLEPSPEAPRAAWLRRVSFDLVGLPPTEQELADFLADTQVDAHERVIDRLLASSHFGERWASMWLDLARYADTMGYEKDPHRDVWPYRDWLIRAFNADMPYGEFTIKQLAGDLLPAASLDDRLATAFHRNTQTNTEGGTDDEEFRTAAVVDRVNTTWQTWQGITFGCAQCHDHPYDALTQRDYYRYLAFFNSTRDSDLPTETPTLATPLDRADFARAEAIDAESDRLRREHHLPLAELAAHADQWTPLALDDLGSTGQTALRFAPSTSEFFAEGTLTNRSRYTLRGPAPQDADGQAAGPITALRLDAWPRD